MSEITVLQLLHSLQVGGAEVLASRLARRLEGKYRFVFCCLDHIGELGEQLEQDGFPICVLNRGEGLDRECVHRLRRQLRVWDVDLIHAHQYTPFFYALAAGILRRRPPVLFTEHGRFHPDYPRRKRILFNRTFLRSQDRVVAVGEAVRQALIVNEGIPEPRTQVIYNGIDLSRFHQQSDSVRFECRAALDLQNTDFVAVLVGRLDYLKDHLTAIRMAQRLAVAEPQFRLLLVGDGPERSRIETEINERGLGQTVRLLGTRHDVPDILQAADVCVLTSISEGIPLTLIEAMAAGRPVVSTNVGGVSEIAVDGQTGLLAPAGDDRALAEQLLNLAKDGALRARMGQTGFQRVEALFDEAIMHRRYEQVFEQMAARRGPSAVREKQVIA